MGAITYLLQRTAINSIKELKKRPLKIIFYLLFTGFMVYAIISGIKMKGNTLKNATEIFNGIFLLLTLLLIFLSIKSGIEKGNSLFRLSDVNFLFPAPIKPQKILIYGFIKQIFASLLFIAIILFQTPNIHMYFPVRSYGGALIAGNMFILYFFCSVLGIFIYSIGSLREKNKVIIKNTLYGLVVLFSLSSIYYIAKYGDIYIGLFKYLNLPFFKYIPIIGWILNIFNGAIYGVNYMTMIYISLTIFAILFIIYIVYNLDLDYYEDALATTETKEEALAKAKSGKGGNNFSNIKIRKTKSKIKYTGAKAILSKQILEAKKTGFAFTDRNNLIFGGVSLVTAYFSKFDDIVFLLYMLTYMNLIFFSTTGWALELNKHYIFLIPESSTKKIIYATVLEIIKSFLNGLVVFTIATFIYKVDIFHGIILAFTYASFSAVILYSDLIIRRMIGDRVNAMVAMFLKILTTIIFVLPGITLSFILETMINKYFGAYGGYLILIVYNTFISLLFVILSKGIFEKIEMR